MGKIAIGQDGSDNNITLKNRGLVTTLVVEQVDANGNIISNPLFTTTGGVGNAVSAAKNLGQRITTTSIPCKRVVVYPFQQNTGPVAVGLSSLVVADDGITKAAMGEQLIAISSTTLYTSDVSNVWFATLIQGDGLSYAYYN